MLYNFGTLKSVFFNSSRIENEDATATDESVSLFRSSTCIHLAPLQLMLQLQMQFLKSTRIKIVVTLSTDTGLIVRKHILPFNLTG